MLIIHCKKIQQSGQPRGRCARVSKSLQTLSVFNGFRNAILRKLMKTHDFSIAKFSNSPSARMLDLWKNQWFLVLWESLSHGNLGFSLQTPTWTNDFAVPRVSMLIIHCKKYHQVDSRAAAARACRNLCKHLVFSMVWKCDIKKTYNNIWFSDCKILKLAFCADAGSL